MLFSHLNVKGHRILSRLYLGWKLPLHCTSLMIQVRLSPFLFYFCHFPLYIGCCSLSSKIIILPWIFIANQINKMHPEPSLVTKTCTYCILETTEDGKFIDFLGLCRQICLLKLNEGKKGNVKGKYES